MLLSINIDHIATLRNARGGLTPDPTVAAQIAEREGANGIVCHLREDRRHIRDDDVKRLRKVVKTKLDLEMAATAEILSIAMNLKPDLVTLVPERRRELTTEGGLDIMRSISTTRKVIRGFHDRGVPVSLFIEPEKNQIEAAKEAGADIVEIHTGKYATARSAIIRKNLLAQIRDMAIFATSLDLIVNAGHGLDYENIVPLVRIREINEVSIGHSIITRAVFVGFETAVREMVKLVQKK